MNLQAQSIKLKQHLSQTVSTKAEHYTVAFMKVTLSSETPRGFNHTQANRLRHRAPKAHNPPPERIAAEWILSGGLGGVGAVLFITAEVGSGYIQDKRHLTFPLTAFHIPTAR